MAAVHVLTRRRRRTQVKGHLQGAGTLFVEDAAVGSHRESEIRVRVITDDAALAWCVGGSLLLLGGGGECPAVASLAPRA